MEPLSALGVASGVAGIISLGISVCDGLLGYYRSCKNARADSARLFRSMERLATILKDLERTIEKPILKHTGFAATETHIIACRQGVDTLQSELERISATSKSQYKFWTKARARALYPFKEKTILNLTGIVDQLVEYLGLAVGTLNLDISADTLRLVSDVNTAINTNNISQGKESTVKQHYRDITLWLSPPDPFSNHNAAIDKRRRDTGQWLLSSAQFGAWREFENSFLWLHGFAGCGKTILTSTAIENTQDYCKLRPGHGIAVFYFDFNDLAKQKAHEMLCSLICQLYSQIDHEISALGVLYERCSHFYKPGVHDLLEVLRELISNFNDVFIILDALDESTEREVLLPILEKIPRWGFKQLHMLITSRREPDIERSLDSLVTNSICIQGKLVDADIQLYIHDQLKQDAKLSQWPGEVRAEIETTLVKGADGMFRWVVCQLEVLQKCLSLRKLREALKTLPETLDETYIRILCGIDDMYRANALRILQVLAYSVRPLTLQEAADSLAIDLCGSPRFDPDLRLREPRALLDICSSLITLRSRRRIVDDCSSEYSDVSYDTDHPSEEELANLPPSGTVVGRKRRRGALHDSVDCAEATNTAELRFAHYSVKEFLVSRVRNGRMSYYYIHEAEAQAVLAKCCLVFLLSLKKDIETRIRTSSIEISMAQFTELLRLFPFMSYAAKYFSTHSRLSKEPTGVVELSIAFFLSKLARNTRDSILRVEYGYPPSWVPTMVLTTNEDCQTPTNIALYYPSLHGLNNTVCELIQNYGACAEGLTEALHAAAMGGFIDVAVSLLDAGADINADLPYKGTAICAAISKEHLAMVQLLITRGADVNFHSEGCMTPLGVAITEHNSSIVELLLVQGAKVDLETIRCAETKSSVFGMLVSHLEKSNDLERFQKMGVVLFDAGKRGDVETMQWLLEMGADVKASGLWSRETALKVAACLEYTDKIQLLLSDIKAKGLFKSERQLASKAASYWPSHLTPCS